MAAAGAGVPPAANDVRARANVALTAQDLMNRPRISRMLDETNGCKDWKRVREWLVGEATAAGEDFKKALLFKGNLEAAPDYSDAMIIDDTGAGAPVETLPQLRQRALKAIVLRTLPENGASWHVVKLCKHAGGRLGTHGNNDGAEQIMMLLDKRWLDSVPDEETEKVAARLYKDRKWPSGPPTSAKFGKYMAEVEEDATIIGHNPTDDVDASKKLRSAWISKLTRPPPGEWTDIIKEARITCGCEITAPTIMEKKQFTDAVIRAIGAQQDGTQAPSAKSGIARAAPSGTVGANRVETDYDGNFCQHFDNDNAVSEETALYHHYYDKSQQQMMSMMLRRPSDREATYRSVNANIAALPPGTARPTVSTRKFPRCPLDSSGNRCVKFCPLTGRVVRGSCAPNVGAAHEAVKAANPT